MLALTRKTGQKIVIGDGIVLTIVDVKGDSVRLAIDAPREVKIYRGELLEAIIAENKDAAVLAKLGDLSALADFSKKK